MVKKLSGHPEKLHIGKTGENDGESVWAGKRL